MNKKNPKDHEGLGDTVEYLLQLMSIDKMVKSVTEKLDIEDCGCTRRKEKLNELFPYKKEEDS